MHVTSQFKLEIAVHVTSFLFSWHELYETGLGYVWLGVERRCLKYTCHKIIARCSDIQRQLSQKMRKKKPLASYWSMKEWGENFIQIGVF